MPEESALKPKPGLKPDIPSLKLMHWRLDSNAYSDEEHNQW